MKIVFKKELGADQILGMLPLIPFRNLSSVFVPEESKG
jgi:hypothetical protein